MYIFRSWVYINDYVIIGMYKFHFREEKEIRGLIRKAMEKKDYLMVALLVYKKVYEMNNR